MNRSLVNARVAVGVVDVVYEPKVRSNRRPVVYCHGNSATATQAVGVGLASVPALLHALGGNRFTVVAPTLPADGIGNDATVTAIGVAIAWSNANLGTTGKAVLLGTSGGAAGVLNYAADNPTLVAYCGLFIPAIDLQAIRVADTGPGLRAIIDAAHGVTYPAALPAGNDPATRTAALTGIAGDLWTASDDGVSVNAAAFAAATGMVQHDVGALGHTDASIAAVSASTLVTRVEAAVAA